MGVRTGSPVVPCVTAAPAGVSHLSHPHSWMAAVGGLFPKDQGQRIRKRQAAAVTVALVKWALDVAGGWDLGRVSMPN